MRVFLARLNATLLRAAILALVFAVCVPRSLAPSVRLVRTVFALARLLSRLITARLRAAAVALAWVVRALRILAASTRLVRKALARATELDLARGVAAIAR